MKVEVRSLLRIGGHKTEVRIDGWPRVVVHSDSAPGMHELMEEFVRWLDSGKRERKPQQVDRKLMKLVGEIFRGRSSVVHQTEDGFEIEIYGYGGIVIANVIGKGTPEDPRDVRVEG